MRGAERKNREYNAAMPTFWYPAAYAARIPFHSNFNANAQATGLTYGLSAGQQTSIARDNTNVPLVVNFKEAVTAYAQAVTEWAEIVLEGEIGAIFPAVPTAPAAPTFALGSETAIRGRTLLSAGIIKADPDYTAEVGENYGIVSPADDPPGTPALVAEALTQSQVRLRITKAGYDTLAIDSRRGGGGWEEIGVSDTAQFIDGRDPLVEGQPEVREYRAQGRVNNVRVGALSAVVNAVTVP